MMGHPARRADPPTPAGLRGGPIYLDYNATTPVDPRVIEAMLPYLTTHFGNPSSSHHYAEQPRRALPTAREQVARLIGAAADEIVFTGSGSEADTLAIHGTVMAHRRPSEAQVITQVTEHPAVLEACRALHRRYGTTVTYLPVGNDGRVNPQDLAEAITPRTALVSIMTANNETGVLQPIDELPASPASTERSSTPTPPRPSARSRSTWADLASTCSAWSATRYTPPRAWVPSTSVPGCFSNPSSQVAGKNAACGPAPRTSPWPPAWAPPPTWPATNWQTTARSGCKSCATCYTGA
jgi:Aminotransferase class-V